MFIRSPWGQNLIVDKFTSNISKKTQTRVEVGRLFITFSGNISLEDVFLEDKKGDTLLYSKYLEVDLPLWPIIRGEPIHLRQLEWEDAVANITRKDSIEGFNFQFLLDAIVTQDTTQTQASTDTTSTQDFRLGKFSLRNIKLRYKDGLSGIDADLNVGNIETDMTQTELGEMKLSFDQTIIENSIVVLQQFEAPTNEESESPLPVLRSNKLEISNLLLDYNSQPDSLSFKGNFQNANLQDLLVDLPEKFYEIQDLEMSNSDLAVNMLVNKEQAPKPVSDSIPWPDLGLKINKINLQNNSFLLTENSAQAESGKFNPAAIELKNLNLLADNLEVSQFSALASIDSLSFQETSGLNLQNLSGKLLLNDDKTEIDNLNLNLNNNSLNGYILADYNTLQDFINHNKASLELDLSPIVIDIRDLFFFQPELRQDPYMAALSKSLLRGNLKARGSMEELQLHTANFSWANSRLSTSGNLSNLSDLENLGFSLPQINFSSSRNDLLNFVSEEDLGIKLPQKIEFQGNLFGNLDNLQSKGDLQSSLGQIVYDGELQSAKGIGFSANMESKDFNLGELLQNESLGRLNLEISASGNGTDINSLDAEVEAMLHSFTYNDYEIKDLPLNLEIENGKGPFSTSFKDENLDLALNGLITLDSVAPAAEINLDLKGANLQALGLTRRNIRTAFQLNGKFKGNASSYDLEAGFTDVIAVYDESPYFSGDIDIMTHVTPDTTYLEIENPILNLKLESNADPVGFADALVEHYRSYLTEVERDTTVPPVNMKLRAQIRNSPFINEVFITQLEELDTVSIAVDFSQENRELMADIDLPRIKYANNVIDSLVFNLDSNAEKFEFDLGFNSIEGGPIAIQNTSVEGRVEDESLFLDFIAHRQDSVLVHVMTHTRRENEEVIISLDPSELILNGGRWDVDPENIITFQETNIAFEAFKLTRNQQLVELDNISGETEKEHIALKFENFRLANIFSYFNPEVELATGRMNGKLVVEEPITNAALLAALEVRDFHVLEAPLGVLRMNAEALGNANYDFGLSLKEGDADLDLTGVYRADEVANELDLDLQLNQLKLSVIEHFSMGEISNASGSLNGNMKITGTTAQPEYSGEFNFNNADFKIEQLNAAFKLNQESISLDNAGIYLKNFTIRDVENNSFVLNGEILTESYLNPKFDLSLEANNFTALDAEEGDNEFVYGKANFDMNAKITGDLNLPRIDGRIKVNKGTNLTYIMPGSELEMMERDGIVRFVNRENPDDILTGNTQEETAVLRGMILNSRIEIEEGAIFTLLIDEQTGDNFRVNGSADLIFNIAANGRTNLSGRYVIKDGHYEMNLYELVNRRFDLVEGSNISWSGDPMDANLDITAVYRVETSASSLMASQLAGSSRDMSARFMQELPFLVYLNVDGELMQPVLSFGLDMPEAEQGAIGGQVYGRVQQLNQQEEELNKQVFSLLVLNRFFPEGGTDGSRGGAAAIARDNLNQALSDQLNRFSDQIMGDSGIELNFGVDSFTDYQGESPQERTTLDVTAQKRLMDDRLIVSVGSEFDVQGSNPTGERPPMFGNVSLEYLLTENGRFRLKGFRRNLFENVIDGQIIVNGIALIFTREFNKFKELFEKAVIEETEQNVGEEVKEETEE
ncbi:translocation/assembly module TamB domain-containing protein [Salegentibacter sp. HM20]